MPLPAPGAPRKTARIWIALGAGTAFVSAYALLRVQRWPNAAAHVYLVAIPVFLWLAMRSTDVPILAVGYLAVPLIATSVLGPRAGLAWMAAMLIVIGQNALASYTSWVMILILAGLGASGAILERERLRQVLEGMAIPSSCSRSKISRFKDSSDGSSRSDGR